MNILITGITGLVGSAAASALAAAGHRVIPLRRMRDETTAAPPCWQPAANRINLGGAGTIDAVIHLAGESIAQRWTAAARERIRSSRAHGTRLLAGALSELNPPPRVMISASATGYYGDRGDEVLDESSATGKGFLADVCREWEAACDPLRARGTRVVHLRTGIVLDRHGGALARMMPAFRLGFGGKLGNGGQYWSWIALDDLVRAIGHILETSTLTGPVNAVAPQPVTNQEFTATLGRALHRPTMLTIPAFALKLAFGAMGREAMLASARVLPARLVASNFVFRHPTLEGALRDLTRT